MIILSFLGDAFHHHSSSREELHKSLEEGSLFLMAFEPCIL